MSDTTTPQSLSDHKKAAPSKQPFFLGLMTGIAVISVIGFVFVLAKGGVGGTKAVDKGAALGAQDEGNAPQEIRMADITKDDHILGDSDAPVKIVEYSDLECPFCKRHHPTMQQIVADYDGDVAWIYRHFPLTSLHSQAPKEAEATECAAELGGNEGFWALTDKIFEVTPANNGLDLATLPDLAAEVGLDKGKFEECLNSGKYAGKVEEQYNDAIAAGGQGTPYNIIIGPNGDKVPLAGAYPIEQFKQIIDGMLNK